ncbi:unnamed protein product [Adineta steineri]|uniref:G-protein coupled receptors family 1 profile domain-containing protein n=1 Tax=Adineta steineri TaxID=433720 RepID=A0A815EAZ9_9BILA|nr:unnamed protein product [Adineta steineri]CAF1307626.1 unnamed protein product [Adineta steineri]CAF1308700.1 unnamed protein product [Adineta steineri]
MSFVNVTIDELNDASSKTILILSLFSIIPGGIGLIFNILVFSRPSMCREPCAAYFFWSTCFSLIYVLILQPVRVLAVSFNIDQANYNLGICKIEFFVFYITRSASSWFIVIACIDRFLHSSANAHFRQMSSLKIAKIVILITSIVIILLHSHMLVYYEISYSSDQFGNIIPACFGRKGIYRTFIGFWNLALYSFCPSILMLFFGLLTLKNLHQHRLVIPVNFETNRQVRRTDTQLLRMLIAQVLVIFICTLPISIIQLYSSFTLNVVKNTLRLAQENLAARIASELTYFAHSSTFYLYTLTGTIFRKELSKIIRQYCRFNHNRLNGIHDETHRMSVLQKSQKTQTHTNHP